MQTLPQAFLTFDSSQTLNLDTSFVIKDLTAGKSSVRTDIDRREKRTLSWLLHKVVKTAEHRSSGGLRYLRKTLEPSSPTPSLCSTLSNNVTACLLFSSNVHSVIQRTTIAQRTWKIVNILMSLCTALYPTCLADSSMAK